MLEEERGELRRAEGAVFGHVSVRPVLVVVAESDALAVVVDDAGVGDGDAVDVAGEVADDVLGAGERPFHVDVPHLGRAAQEGEILCEVAVDLSRAKGSLELGEEPPAKELPEAFDGEEELSRRRDPPRGVEGEPAGGDDAVERLDPEPPPRSGFGSTKGS